MGVKQTKALKLAREALNLARAAHGQMLMSDPPQEAWKAWNVAATIREAMQALTAALADNALDKMAKNAREIGLDYEPVAYIRVRKTGHVMACAKTADFYSLPDGALLYTRPQARERIQFPTMLRKMWSGTEVQQWLDENVNRGEK